MEPTRWKQRTINCCITKLLNDYGYLTFNPIGIVTHELAWYMKPQLVKIMAEGSEVFDQLNGPRLRRPSDLVSWPQPKCLSYTHSSPEAVVRPHPPAVLQ
jgi:hypothetical protein